MQPGLLISLVIVVAYCALCFVYQNGLGSYFYGFLFPACYLLLATPVIHYLRKAGRRDEDDEEIQPTEIEQDEKSTKVPETTQSEGQVSKSADSSAVVKRRSTVIAIPMIKRAESTVGRKGSLSKKEDERPRAESVPHQSTGKPQGEITAAKPQGGRIFEDRSIAAAASRDRHVPIFDMFEEDLLVRHGENGAEPMKWDLLKTLLKLTRASYKEVTLCT